VSCEGERKCEIVFLMVMGPRGQKLHELGTPCPEYPGLRSEYPGKVLQSYPLKEISSRNLKRKEKDQKGTSMFSWSC
jgi:hypothetical protein